MSSVENIIRKVRKIEIVSRGLSQNIFSGAYHTAFKGRGISFSEIREYTPGDDIRLIDWKVSARLKSTYVKVFHEERELTVMMMVDVSTSMKFGSFHENKKDFVAEIAGVLAFSAVSNNDKVGLILYSDKIEKYIPPKRGRSHVLRIIREIIAHPQTGVKASDTGFVIEFLNKIHKKKSVCFLISDFQEDIDASRLSITARKHDLIGLHIYDELERNMPDAGWIRVQNPEQSTTQLINTSDPQVRKKNQDLFDSQARKIQDAFLQNSAAWLSISTAMDYVRPLQKLFNSRRKK